MTDELKKADEIVRALRAAAAKWEAKNKFIGTGELRVHDALNDAADLIESLQAQIADYHHMSELVDGKMAENQRLRRINENLQAQLAESQRREQAAVEDFEGCMKNKKERCAYCIHDDECEPGESLCYANVCGFEWRGPQEAGEGAK